MASDKRYGPAPKQPQDAASLLDMIDGPITIVGEAELAELRRKAAAWDAAEAALARAESLNLEQRAPEMLYHGLRTFMRNARRAGYGE